jgi:hypothetical protein
LGNEAGGKMKSTNGWEEDGNGIDESGFLVFQAVTVTPLVNSTVLANTVTGGVLRSALRAMPGNAVWILPMAPWAGPPLVRWRGSLLVASGVRIY